MNIKKFRLEAFYRASISRHFEDNIYKLVKNGKIKFPVYFSAGQEYVSCSIASYFSQTNINPMLFGQHRGHSIYIGFGGSLNKLALEFFGKKNGCTYGMGGSLSIHSSKINMYGHDGFMGSNVPIGIGASFSTKKPSIIFIGDAAVEEDYVLASISWIAKKKIPTLIVVEDNNFAITTSKDERRDWSVKSLGKAFKIESFDVEDDPIKILKYIKNYNFKKPRILNIRTNRLYWHAGAGIDNENVFDRLKFEKNKIGIEAHELYKKADKRVKKIFENVSNEK